MRENDGRKLDHKTLEALRLRAVDQVQQGAHPEDVAAALGLHRKTVYGWLKTYRDGGRGALLARPAPGRPPRLGQLHMRRMWTRGMKRPRFKADDPDHETACQDQCLRKEGRTGAESVAVTGRARPAWMDLGAWAVAHSCW